MSAEILGESELSVAKTPCYKISALQKKATRYISRKGKYCKNNQLKKWHSGLILKLYRFTYPYVIQPTEQ